jgi:hypothetical protein
LCSWFFCSTSQPLLNLYLPSPSTPPASRPIAGAQRSRSQIDEKKDERKDNVVASGSLPNESPVVVIPVPHGNDTSSPLSSSSVSSSPSMSHESWSPAKPRALSRTSTGSAVSRRRSSDSKERDTNAGVIMQHRHSIATMEVDESVFPIPIPLNDDDSIRQHLKDLQKPVSRSRSDSLSRLRDSASGLITPAISSSLQQGTNNGSDGALSRISASLKNSSLRLPESLSGNNSPSGNGSSDPSPTVSPGASPRSRVPRTVMKAAEALEGLLACLLILILKRNT